MSVYRTGFWQDGEQIKEGEDGASLKDLT